jgi:hypothetical protein
VGNRSVFFTLRQQLSHEEQQSTLRSAKQVPGISQVASLDETSPAEPVRRIFFASLDGDVDAETVRQALQNLPHVESASLPTERKLP